MGDAAVAGWEGMRFFPLVCFALAFTLMMGLEVSLAARDRGRLDPGQDQSSLQTISRLLNAAFLESVLDQRRHSYIITPRHGSIIAKSHRTI